MSNTQNTIALVPVQSSNVKAIGFENNTLAVEFSGGGIYHYDNVPRGVYDKLLVAESVGKFIGANIKGKYKFTRVGVAA